MTPGTEVGDEGVAPDPGDELQRALDVAYRRVARADQSVAQVRQHLGAKGVEPAVVDTAVEILADQGYLDDARYARRFVEDRRNLDCWGVHRIEQRLLAAGIDPDLVAAAVARPPQDELEAAVALLERRVGPGPCDARERDRALGLLIRRGYDFELACDAVRAHARGRNS